MTWKTSFMGNEVLDDQKSGFFISYRSAENDRFASTGFAQDPRTVGETALVTPKGEVKYRILNGDFKKEYEAVYPDLDACIKVFESHPDAVSSWSE